MPALTWSYGVTTVPERSETSLTITLASLRMAGFPDPTLFVDGCSPEQVREYATTNIVTRPQRLGPWGNWWLTLVELYLRNPKADRYAIFQDDFVTYQNLRSYLDRCKYPERGYWNLFTAFKLNEHAVVGKRPGWYEAPPMSNHPTVKDEIRWQGGKGAVGLVFSCEAVITLLQSRSLITKCKAVDKHISYKRVDGGVVNAMNEAGWREYIHTPSLVQHLGEKSSCGNGSHPQAQTFRGETFDAMKLLG